MAVAFIVVFCPNQYPLGSCVQYHCSCVRFCAGHEIASHRKVLWERQVEVGKGEAVRGAFPMTLIRPGSVGTFVHLRYRKFGARSNVLPASSI
jgi:hypothetical protein